MEVPNRRLGAAIFRKLEGLIEVAAPEALRGLCSNDRAALGGSATTYAKAEKKVSLGFVEGLSNKIRAVQRRAPQLLKAEALFAN